MNFEEAISAHATWKVKLKSYLSNPDGTIDVQKLEKDNQCALGCWLHGPECAQYKSLPEFSELIAEHKKFHAEAANIVRRKDAGENVSEDVAIGSNSDFSKASTRVTTILMGFARK